MYHLLYVLKALNSADIVYFCALHGTQKNQRFYPCTALIDCFLHEDEFYSV